MKEFGVEGREEEVRINRWEERVVKKGSDGKMGAVTEEEEEERWRRMEGVLRIGIKMKARGERTVGYLNEYIFTTMETTLRQKIVMKKSTLLTGLTKLKRSGQ